MNAVESVITQAVQFAGWLYLASAAWIVTRQQMRQGVEKWMAIVCAMAVVAIFRVIGLAITEMQVFDRHREIGRFAIFLLIAMTASGKTHRI